MNSQKAREILKEANLHKTYWGNIIIRQENKNEGFSSYNEEKAKSWTTCACGHAIKKFFYIERNSHGSPRDDMLYDLGEKFHKYIKKNLYEEAAECLVKIEDRAKFLQKEYIKKYLNGI